MLGFLVFCLFCLPCFAATLPSCDKLSPTECAPYYCVVDLDTTVNPAKLKCVEDTCSRNYRLSGDAKSCSSITVGATTTACKRVTYRFGDGSDYKEGCVTTTNHFSECRLTIETLGGMPHTTEADAQAMETKCDELGCGGVYQFYDDDDVDYYQCEEPGNDGTEQPNDFDVSNCKKYEYKVIGGKCDWDPCASYDTLNTDGNLINSNNPSETCSSSSDDCVEVTVDETVGSKLCLRANEASLCGSGSWNLDILTSDACALKGCGGLDVAISKNKNSYKFCLPPPTPVTTPECPKKNGASYLRVSIIILAITIFAFL